MPAGRGGRGSWRGRGAGGGGGGHRSHPYNGTGTPNRDPQTQTANQTRQGSSSFRGSNNHTPHAPPRPSSNPSSGGQQQQHMHDLGLFDSDPTHRPKKTRSVSDPFEQWSVYLPGELYTSDHDLIPVLHDFVMYFERVFSGDVDANKGHMMELLHNQRWVIPVQYSHLVAASGLDELEDRVKRQPVETLACLSLAASEVIERMREQYELLHVNAEEDGPLKRVARLINMNEITPLKDLKANLMNRFISLRGAVVRISSVKPIIQEMEFACNACGEGIHMIFNDGQYRAPTKCTRYGCKSRVFTPQRGPDKTNSVDWQRIRIQEKLADNQVDSGRIPRTVECELTEDLVDLVVPGDVVCVSGVVKVLASDEEKGKGRATQMYSLYIAANSLVKASGVSSSEEEEEEAEEDPSKVFTKDNIRFSKKELYGVQEIWKRGDVFRLLVNSLCPSIFGHEMVKAGLLLTLLGGRNRCTPDSLEMSIRSDPHILIVGDPGLGKSQMLSAVCKVAPRGVYVCGNSTTTSGLTVTMVKDAETGETALEAGALVLGDQGVCCIDEFDKMTEHQALLEAMEQQSISIAKAGIVATLPARTSVIAAANPVGGHYNKAKTVSENLKMNSALLSRFDLVFILLDKPDEEMDMFLSEHIIKLHSGSVKSEQKQQQIRKHATLSGTPGLATGEEEDLPLADRLKVGRDEFVDPVPFGLLRKYIAYARRYVQPVLTPEAAAVLQRFYLSLRSKYRTIDATPITTRQLESMIRLAEARARVALRTHITPQDASDVIQLMKFSLWETYTDETGTLDFSRSQHGTGMSKSNAPKKFVARLHDIATLAGNNRFTHENLGTVAREMGVRSEQEVSGLIDTLNNQGYLLKKGYRIYQLTTM